MLDNSATNFKVTATLLENDKIVLVIDSVNKDMAGSGKYTNCSCNSKVIVNNNQRTVVFSRKETRVVKNTGFWRLFKPNRKEYMLTFMVVCARREKC